MDELTAPAPSAKETELTKALEASAKRIETLTGEVTAAQEGLKARTTEFNTLKGNSDKLAADLKAATDAVVASQGQLMDVRRAALVSGRGVKAELVKGMTAEQLDALERVLPAITLPNAANLDAGGTNGRGADTSGRPESHRRTAA